MRGYLSVLRGTIMERLMYRTAFIFTIVGNIVYIGVVYYLWRSIYRNTTTIHDLSFNEAFLYVALGGTFFILLNTYTDWSIADDIYDGMIAVYLTKPIDYQVYALSISLGEMLTTVGAITIPTALLLAFVFKVDIPLGLGLIIFPLSLFLAFLISFCFDYFIGMLSFYTESIWGISITKETLISVLAGALIPLQFFPDAIQRILLVLPFQAIYYTPLMMVIRPDQSWQTLSTMLLTQLVWVVMLFLLTRLFYHQAIKVLRVGGG